jgi:hypothetical protein
MPLPSNYDDPAGMAAAELAIRTAIRDIFAGTALAYGFPDDHCHECPRFPDTDAEWDAVAMVDDPDTQAAQAAGKKRIMRYMDVYYQGHRRASKQDMTLRYIVSITMTLKDSYASDPNKRALNEIVELDFKFGKTIDDNQELGLDDRVSHNYLQTPTRPLMTPVDDQGRTIVTLFNTLEVNLKVC